MGRDNNNNRGRGGRGRGRGRNNGRNNNKNKTASNKKEYKFMPHGSGKQTCTYASVKEHIEKVIQQKYDEPDDMIKSLRELKVVSIEKPKMRWADPDVDVEDDEMLAKSKFVYAQKACEIEYQSLMNEHTTRVSRLRTNLTKAYGMIFEQYCSKVIQQRVEEHPDFEDVIRDDPIELLKVIKIIMCEPVRARFPIGTGFDVLKRFIELRQNESEDLIDYVKRFKQQRDVVKSMFGSEMFIGFIRQQQEYLQAVDSGTKEDLRQEIEQRFTAYMLLRNSDQKKYGSLLTTLSTQYALNNDQFPRTIRGMTDVMSNHRHDNHGKQNKNNKKGKQADDSKSDKEKTDTQDTSFAQQGSDVWCWVCGKKGHKVPQCPLKDKVAKSEWKINTVHSQLCKETEDNDSGSESEQTSKKEKRRKWIGATL